MLALTEPEQSQEEPLLSRAPFSHLLPDRRLLVQAFRVLLLRAVHSITLANRGAGELGISRACPHLRCALVAAASTLRTRSKATSDSLDWRAYGVCFWSRLVGRYELPLCLFIPRARQLRDVDGQAGSRGGVLCPGVSQQHLRCRSDCFRTCCCGGSLREAGGRQRRTSR